MNISVKPCRLTFFSLQPNVSTAIPLAEQLGSDRGKPCSLIILLAHYYYFMMDSLHGELHREGDRIGKLYEEVFQDKYIFGHVYRLLGEPRYTVCLRQEETNADTKQVSRGDLK